MTTATTSRPTTFSPHLSRSFEWYINHPSVGPLSPDILRILLEGYEGPKASSDQKNKAASVLKQNAKYFLSPASATELVWGRGRGLYNDDYGLFWISAFLSPTNPIPRDIGFQLLELIVKSPRFGPRCLHEIMKIHATHGASCVEPKEMMQFATIIAQCRKRLEYLRLNSPQFSYDANMILAGSKGFASTRLKEENAKKSSHPENI